MGPTATGKTALAVQLATQFPFEIISVDSAMVYRDMDIGTAKPTREELKIVPHHLIDICDPKESYSVGRFRHDVLAKITDIFAREKIPLLVGGTMMYFKILEQGISVLPEANQEVRQRIMALQDEFGLEALYLRLKQIDPQTAKNISRTDSQRIWRALEVYELTGKTLSELRLLSPPEVLPYEIINFALVPDNISNLRIKIKDRFQKMLELGFIREAEKLYSRGDLHVNLPAIRTVGYRQVWQYLSGKINYKQMLELIPIATGQLAKRQLTWLKRWRRVAWFQSNNPNLLSQIVDKIKF